jgi:hypothetical protein
VPDCLHKSADKPCAGFDREQYKLEDDANGGTDEEGADAFQKDLLGIA